MEQANLNIGTIGQRLEAARMAKGVSVSEAGQATKILSKFIEAMESDDFGALSAPVYAKSFIRMYARYLGLDDRGLVDEYVAQHVPKTKVQLSDEVKQNLAKTDQVPGDQETYKPPAPLKSSGGSVFGDVNEAITRLSGSGIPFKIVLPAAGAILLIGIIVLTAAQCSDEEVEEPVAAGGAATMEHRVITDGVPDAYMVKPGVVEVDKR